MARPGAAAHRAAHDSTPLVGRVFAALCEGRFHSGEQLARSLGVSRSAIWKATGSLRELGATLHAVRNRGYRVPGASEPLDAAKIRERLAPDVRHHVRSLEATWSTASTNSVLLERANPPSALTEVSALGGLARSSSTLLEEAVDQVASRLRTWWRTSGARRSRILAASSGSLAPGTR